MNKKFAAIGVMALALTTCSTPSQAIESKPTVLSVTQSNNDIQHLVQRWKKDFTLKSNRALIERSIVKLRKHVGKTWYVFSGNTPRGWDCSGMTMWFYEQMGISLKHSASHQKHAGKIVKSPQIGDIVAFGWKGWSGSGHVGIYVGQGLMIHSPMPGHSTRVENITDFAKNSFSKITYTRFLEID